MGNGFHGYVSHNQRVSHNEKVLFENTIFAAQVCQFHPPQDGTPVFDRVQLPKSDWILWFMVDFKLYLMGFTNQIIAKLP